MALYSIYLLRDDKIAGPPYYVECGSDAEARDQVAEVIGDHPAAEIWIEARLVGRVTAEECSGGMTTSPAD